MAVSKTQGGTANSNGRRFETYVGGALSLYYERVERADFGTRAAAGDRVFAAQYFRFCESIYDGHFLKPDAVIADPDMPWFNGQLVIEMKSQESPGSVDEKLPFVVECARTAYPASVLLVLHGDGFKQGARTWVQRQVDGERFLGVVESVDFPRWLRDYQAQHRAVRSAGRLRR